MWWRTYFISQDSIIYLRVIKMGFKSEKKELDFAEKDEKFGKSCFNKIENINFNKIFLIPVLTFVLVIFLISVLLVLAIVPSINYVSPTPVNNVRTTNESVEFKISINEENLDKVIYNWNGTNFTIYNDSLVLMFNFNNYSNIGEDNIHIFDISGNGNNGTANGDAIPVVGGKYDGAYTFDGNGDYVQATPTGLPSGSNSRTIMAWIKATNTDSVRVPFAYGNSGASQGGAFGFYINSDETLHFWGMGSADFPTGAVVTTNDWQHVAVTYDGSNVKVYLDAVQVGPTTSRTLNTGNSGLFIGSDGNIDPASYHYSGLIDEVMVWNRELSSDEIYQQFASNLNKINTDSWELYVNQSKNSTMGLDFGDYTYQVFAENDGLELGSSEERSISIVDYIDMVLPILNYESPTFENNFNYTKTYFGVNVSIIEDNLDELIYNFDGQNYSYYNDSLVFMSNFNNNSVLGDTTTNALDISGNENNVTLSNSDMITSNGKYDGGLFFDGVNDYGEISHSSSLNFNNKFSISFWLKMTPPSEDGQIIIGKASSTTNYEGDWWVKTHSINQVDFQIRDSSSSIHTVSVPAIMDGTWHHIVETYDGTNQIVYVDGELGNSGSWSGTIFNANQSIYIGKSFSATSDGDIWFDGSIDELKIWNKSISSLQAYQEYISNFKKVNDSEWTFFINQSKSSSESLDEGSYSYNLFASDEENNFNYSGERIINIEYPSFNITLTTPNETSNVIENNLFRNSVEICCLHANCGNITSNIYKRAYGNLVNTTNLITQGIDLANDVSSSADYPPNERDNEAFDQSVFTKWLTHSVSTGWIVAELSSAKRMWKYEICSANDEPTRDPDDWTIQGSNDGSSWNVLDTVTNNGLFGSRQTCYTYYPDTIGNYKYYKMDITQNNGDAHMQVSEIKFYEQTAQLISSLVPTIPNSSAFWTNATANTQNVFLFENECDNLTWWINASQTDGETSTLYVSSILERDSSYTNMSSFWNITTYECISNNDCQIGYYCSANSCLLSPDTNNPTWSNNKTNVTSSTQAGDVVYFNITLSDENPNKYIFSLYNGTSWYNYSPVSYSNNQEIRILKQINISSGVINWTWYFNDTYGNFNKTDTWSIEIDSYVEPDLEIYYNDTTTLNSSTIYSKGSLSVNITFVGSNATIYLYNSSGFLNSTTSSSSPFFVQYSNINPGSYFFNASVIATNLTTQNLETRQFNVIVDDVSPIVDIISPTSASIGTNLINFNFSYIEPNLDTCWISNSSGNYSTSCYSNITNFGVHHGTNTLTFFVNDTYGNIGYDTVSFYSDLIAPTITLLNTPTGFITKSYVKLSAGASDYSLNNIALNLYNTIGLYSSISTNYTSISKTYQNLPDGIYYYNFTATDSFSNSSSSVTKSFIIDNTDPEIELKNPTGNLNISLDAITFSFNATDLYLKSCGLYMKEKGFADYYLVNSTSNLLSGQNTNLVVSNLDDTSYLWYIRCIDNSSNSKNSDIYNLTVDTVSPEITIYSPVDNDFLGYNIFINTNIDDLNSNIHTANYSLLNASDLSDVLYSGSLTENDGWDANWSSLDYLDEQFTIVLKIDANDTFGNSQSENVTFYLDNVKPSIQLINPARNNAYFNSNMSLNISVQDASLNFTNYTILNTAISNSSIYPGNTFSHNWSDLIEINSLLDGIYNLSVYALDAGSNIRITSTNLTIDTESPSISLNYPNSNLRTASSNITFNWTATDNLFTNLKCDLYVNGELLKRDVSCINNSECIYVATNLAWGDYNWYVLCEDGAGNINPESGISFIPDWRDSDGDNTHDNIDNLIGDESDVNETGIINFDIKVGGSSELTTFNDSKEVIFYEDDEPLITFTHNFTENSLNLGDVSIKKNNSYMIINLSDQLQGNKTIYVRDYYFTSLCVKDMHIVNISEISENCTGIAEYNFNSCINNNNPTIIDGIICTDLGSQFKIENLQYSAVRGVSDIPCSTIEEDNLQNVGTSLSGGKIYPLIKCGDGVCFVGVENCMICENDCGVCKNLSETIQSNENDSVDDSLDQNSNMNETKIEPSKELVESEINSKSNFFDLISKNTIAIVFLVVTFVVLFILIIFIFRKKRKTDDEAN
jgi:hypothetical protein